MIAQYLIVYDISDPRRLQRVAKTLKDYAQRMQKSVFEARLDDAQLRQLVAKLCHIAKPEDGIKIFRLCEPCCGRRSGIGIMRERLPDMPWQIL